MTHYTNRVRRKEKWLTPRVTLRRLPVAVLSRKALRARLPRAANKAILTKKALNDNSFGAFFCVCNTTRYKKPHRSFVLPFIKRLARQNKKLLFVLNGKTYFF